MKFYKKQIFIHAVLYGSPLIGQSILMSPIFILGGIYARYYEFSLENIAFVFLITRVFDAVIDPLIGFLSDYIFFKTGSRKFIIALGGLTFCLASCVLYIPGKNPISLQWFCSWFFMFYLGATMLSIPYMSWASDLSRSSEARAIFYSSFIFSYQAGSFFFFLIPFMPFFDDQEITPEVLKIATLFGVLLLCFSLVITLRYLPDGDLSDNPPESGSFSLISYFHHFYKNKPFLIFVGASLFYGLANGAWYGLIFIYIDSYLGMGRDFVLVSLIGMLTGLFSTIVGRKLIFYIGLKPAWLIFMVIFLSGVLLVGTLTPSGISIFPLSLGLIFVSSSSVCISIVLMTLLSALSDYGKLKDNNSQSAGYFSLYTFLTKFQSAIGNSLALFVVGLFGFQASVNSLSQSEFAVVGIKVGAILIPFFCSIISIVFIVNFPLNDSRINTIRRALLKR